MLLLFSRPNFPVNRGGTAIRCSPLWSMQRRKIKTKGMREQDDAEGRRTHNKNANQTQFFQFMEEQEREESYRIGRRAG